MIMNATKKHKFAIISLMALVSALILPAANSDAPFINLLAPSEVVYADDSTSGTPGDVDVEPAPAVNSIEIDARELLFGAKGDALTLKLRLKPKGADAKEITFKSSDTSVATVNRKGKVKAKGWGVCTISVSSGKAKAKCKVTVAKKWVALTFDDGPGDYTNKLLSAMRKRGVHATFFVVGSMAAPKGRMKLVKKAFLRGNEIGNHTYKHDGSAGVLLKALRMTDDVVKKAIGINTKLMRPPGGVINSATYKCKKPIIMWSVDPKDWRDRNSQTVYKRVIDGTKSGSIVLLHDIHPTSVNAAIRIMDSLKDKGYAFVTVSQLLGRPKAGKVYNAGPAKVRTMKIRY
jgi:peptidoglycan/xylan/chitin deacetylase (PgdA/CDA1 family)